MRLVSLCAHFTSFDYSIHAFYRCKLADLKSSLIPHMFHPQLVVTERQCVVGQYAGCSNYMTSYMVSRMCLRFNLGVVDGW